MPLLQLTTSENITCQAASPVLLVTTISASPAGSKSGVYVCDHLVPEQQITGK